MAMKRFTAALKIAAVRLKIGYQSLKPASTPPPIETERKSGTSPERGRRLWETAVWPRCPLWVIRCRTIQPQRRPVSWSDSGQTRARLDCPL